MARNITVTAGRHAGAITDYTVPAGTTVEEVLSKAGIELTKGDKIRVNGDDAVATDTLKNEDIVTVTGRVAGGTR